MELVVKKNLGFKKSNKEYLKVGLFLRIGKKLPKNSKSLGQKRLKRFIIARSMRTFLQKQEIIGRFGCRDGLLKHLILVREP